MSPGLSLFMPKEKGLCPICHRTAKLDMDGLTLSHGTTCATGYSPMKEDFRLILERENASEIVYAIFHGKSVIAIPRPRHYTLQDAPLASVVDDGVAITALGVTKLIPWGRVVIVGPGKVELNAV